MKGRHGRVRSYSKQSREAMSLLGRLIRLGRKEHRMTAQEVAERAGITRGTLRGIENGDPKSEIGLAFEVAVIVGVPLFLEEGGRLGEERRRVEDKLALLPKRVRHTDAAVKDDF
jgi:DNA-binding XRE family transcriptional regulator